MTLLKQRTHRGVQAPVNKKRHLVRVQRDGDTRTAARAISMIMWTLPDHGDLKSSHGEWTMYSPRNQFEEPDFFEELNDAFDVLSEHGN